MSARRFSVEPRCTEYQAISQDFKPGVKHSRLRKLKRLSFDSYAARFNIGLQLQFYSSGSFYQRSYFPCYEAFKSLNPRDSSSFGVGFPYEQRSQRLSLTLTLRCFSPHNTSLSPLIPATD